MRAAAALCVSLLAACGDGRPGAADASTDSGLAAPVRLKVAGISSHLRVFFQAADGTVEAVTYTNDAGEANAFVPAGGFVTLRAGNGELFTWAGVEPGDQLVLGSTPDPGDSVLMRVSVPEDPAATAYSLETSCGGGELDITGAQFAPVPVILTGCGGVADLMVLTYGSPTPTNPLGPLLHAVPRLAVPLGSAQVSVVVPGPLLEILPSHLAFARAPADVEQIDTWQSVVTDHGTVFTTSGKPKRVDLVADPTTLLAVPQIAGTRAVSYVRETDVGGQSRLGVIAWGPNTGETVVDLGAGPPPLSSINWDPTRLTVSWSQQGVPGEPELAVAELTFQDGTHWHAVGRRGPLPQLALPSLPDPELLPAPGAAVVSATVTAVEATIDLGRLRSTMFNNLTGSAWAIEGSSGRIVYRELDH